MKKIYDIKRGHYVVLNEDDSNAQTTADSQQANAAAEAAEKQRQLSADVQDKISKLDTEKSNYMKMYQTKKQSIESEYTNNITTQNDMLAVANQSVASAVDSASKSKAQSEVIAIRKRIADIELKKAQDMAKNDLEYAQNLYKTENAKLQVLTNANASTVAERWNMLPEKYRRVLNESNIHLAKIYMKTLIQNDEDHIIKDMREFSRVFRESGLVYGKDKTDYYVICIDQDDFNKLYATLQGVGYSRDEIFAVVMPQLLDRSTMLDAGSK